MFQNFTSSFFLKSKFSTKNSVFPYIFHTKNLYWTRILRSPPFHFSHGEVWFSSHNNTRNTMYITFANVKKNSRSRFFKPQPARASLIANQRSIGFGVKLQLLTKSKTEFHNFRYNAMVFIILPQNSFPFIKMLSINELINTLSQK